MKVYAWLIDFALFLRENCPTGIILEWMQKVTQHTVPNCTCTGLILYQTSDQWKWNHEMGKNGMKKWIKLRPWTHMSSVLDCGRDNLCGFFGRFHIHRASVIDGLIQVGAMSQSGRFCGQQRSEFFRNRLLYQNFGGTGDGSAAGEHSGVQKRGHGAVQVRGVRDNGRRANPTGSHQCLSQWHVGRNSSQYLLFEVLKTKNDFPKANHTQGRSHTGPIIHRTNRTQGQSHTGPIIYGANHIQDQSHTGPIAHRANHIQGQSHRGPIIHRTNRTQGQSHTGPFASTGSMFGVENYTIWSSSSNQMSVCTFSTHNVVVDL